MARRSARNAKRENPAEFVEEMENARKKRRKKAQSQKKKANPSDQTDEERKKIRNEYRNLRSQTLANREALVATEGDTFQKMLDKQDDINEKVLHASEAVFDAEQLKLMASLGAEQAQRLSSKMMSITTEEFVRALRRRFGDQNQRVDSDNDDETDSRDDSDPEALSSHVSIDWTSLGSSESLTSVKDVPLIDFMNGVLGVEVTQRQRRRKEDQYMGQTLQAKNREQTEEQRVNAKSNADSRVVLLSSILKRVKSAHLFEFIINPSSFPQSVENLYDLSFLIQAGKAGFVKKPNGEIFVEYHNSSDGTEETIESIFCLTKKMFNTALEVYDLGKKPPIIPDRRY